VGTELAAITERTTETHAFIERLRWTNAYRRLGMGF